MKKITLMLGLIALLGLNVSCTDRNRDLGDTIEREEAPMEEGREEMEDVGENMENAGEELVD